MWRRSCSLTTLLRQTNSWTLWVAVPGRYSVFFVFIAIPNPATCSSARQSAANTCFVNPGSDRRAAAVGADKVPARTALTACPTARQALPMRSLHCRRQRDATSSRRPRRNASHLKILATTRSAITGPICAATESRAGHVSGVTELPVSVLRALPRPNGEDWIPSSWQRISGTLSWAWSEAGLVPWIRSAVARSAASNSSARPGAPLGGAIFVNLHRGG